MKIKTSELQGTALDWAVAQAEGNVRLQYDSREGLIINNVLGWIPYRPSTDWAQGGPIMGREKIGAWWATHVVDGEGNEYGNHWYAETGMTDDNADEPVYYATGETALIAAMRCYVASKLGEEVDVPEELTLLGGANETNS